MKSNNPISQVNVINIVDNSYSSVVQFGDRVSTSKRSYLITIKQNRSNFFSGEPRFSDFRAFRKYFYLPSSAFHTTVELNKVTEKFPLPSAGPEKFVRKINIVGISTASTVQIGNGEQYYSINREKSFNQLL